MRRIAIALITASVAAAGVIPSMAIDGLGRPAAFAGEATPLSGFLGEGMRPASIRVEPTTALVFPGDRVDVLLIGMVNGQIVASVILQDVRVLSYDDEYKKGSSPPRRNVVATVELDVRDAQKLALAQQTGKLALLPRWDWSGQAQPSVPDGEAGRKVRIRRRDGGTELVPAD